MNERTNERTLPLINIDKLSVFKKSIKKYLTVHYHPFKLHINQNNNADSSDSSFYTDDSD